MSDAAGELAALRETLRERAEGVDRARWSSDMYRDGFHSGLIEAVRMADAARRRADEATDEEGRPGDDAPPGDDLLTAFLYVLARDGLPLGQLNQVLGSLEFKRPHTIAGRAEGSGLATRFELSNPYLAGWARDAAVRIRRGGLGR